MSDAIPDYVSATLGIDIGNSHSKQTLSFYRNGILKLCPVEFVGDDRHPNAPRAPEAAHEICSRAGFDARGQVVVGRAALKLDSSFTIKDLLLFCAIGVDEVVTGTPDGPELLDAVSRGLIGPNTVEDMILQHLCFLCKLVDEAASTCRVRVTRIGLSYPDFLCPDEDPADTHIDDYVNFLEEKVRQAFGMAGFGASLARYYSVSEGQSTAQYIYGRFVEDILGFPQNFTQTLFEGLDMESHTPLVIYDGGSSSLSVHVLVMAFDENLKIVNGWSIDIDGLKPGVQGGSDIANSVMKRRLRESQKTMNVPPGMLAVYSQDFETHKRNIDFEDGLDSDLAIRLGGRGANTIAHELPAQDVRDIMHAGFDAVLDLIKTTNQRLCTFQVDFAILFCGGTLTNLGARSVLERDMVQLQQKAGAQGNNVRYGFLVDKDRKWSSAVSAGTSLCILNMPLPGPLLKNSAIGVQRMDRAASSRDWEGENEADILFCGGAGTIWCSDQNSYEPGRKVKFSLVIDPEYNANRSRTDSQFDPLKINGPDAVFTGSHATHDLGWSVEADGLPQGNIRFAIGGNLLDQIAKGVMSSAEEALEGITFVFSCFGLDSQGRESYDPMDKKWQATIRTDPGTKRLMIAGPQELPARCSHCKQELEGTAQTCKTCADYTVCALCHLHAEDNHPRGHSFLAIRIPKMHIMPEIGPASKPLVYRPVNRAMDREGQFVTCSVASSTRNTTMGRTAMEAYEADFPAGSHRIPTAAAGLQCAWAALALSWNAQRRRLETLTKSQYREISDQELSNNFRRLRNQDPTFASHMDNTHTFRVDQMALNITDLVSRNFGINVQMGYVYPRGEEKNAVLVPLADGLEAGFRLWVYNNNVSEEEWSHAHFEGLQDRPTPDAFITLESSELDDTGPLQSQGLSTDHYSNADLDTIDVDDTSRPGPSRPRRGRPRTRRICDSCRRHKLNCRMEQDGASCSQCRRRHGVCQFSNLQETRSASLSTTITNATPKRGRGRPRTRRVCDSCRKHKLQCHTKNNNGPCSRCRRRNIVCVFEGSAPCGDARDDEDHGGPSRKHNPHHKQAEYGTFNATRHLFRAEKAWSVTDVKTILPADIVPTVWTQRTVSSLNKLARLTGMQYREWAIVELTRQVAARPVPLYESRQVLREAAVRATVTVANREGKETPDVEKNFHFLRLKCLQQHSIISLLVELARVKSRLHRNMTTSAAELDGLRNLLSNDSKAAPCQYLIHP